LLAGREPALARQSELRDGLRRSWSVPRLYDAPPDPGPESAAGLIAGQLEDHTYGCHRLLALVELDLPDHSPLDSEQTAPSSDSVPHAVLRSRARLPQQLRNLDRETASSHPGALKHPRKSQTSHNLEVASTP
jgi:hypothetical protein